MYYEPQLPPPRTQGEHSRIARPGNAFDVVGTGRGGPLLLH